MAKKKSRKKRAVAPGVDPNERRRERLEARRRERAEAIARARRAQSRERFVRFLLLGALLAGAVWFFFLRGRLPDEIGGHTLIKRSTAGANQHTDQPVEYDIVPPVSGEHATNPAQCGIHATVIPNENFVHTLEHGAVALVYRPDIPEEDIRALEEIAGDFDSHTVAAPNPEMDDPITIAAWAHLMRLDEVDEDAIREFIEVFRQGGASPEAGQECPNSVEQPFQAEPSPSPTGATGDGGEEKDGKGDG